MKHEHKLFGPRRRAPNDGGALSPSGMFTKKAAEQRRWDMAIFVLKAIPAEEFLSFMQSPRPPSIQELIKIAQQRATENPWTCPHCDGPLPHLKRGSP
jgi:hypothetical protein